MIAYLLPRDGGPPAVDALHADNPREALRALAEDFSPRVECDARGVALDASGLSRLFGGADALARELAKQSRAKGLSVCVAIAPTRTAAALAAHQSLESWTVGRSDPPTIHLSNLAALAAYPLERLCDIADLIGPALAKAAAKAPKVRRRGQGRNYRLAPGPSTDAPPVGLAIERLRRWGLTSLGDLVSLPASELSARLGDAGFVLQRAARGEDERPLVPAAPPVSFRQSLQLEWPVEDLQPLSFVISRLCESLEQALARADRGAIALTTLLRLTTKEVYARTLTLPAPMRDARVLRTLVMLDLESHPPGAAVDEVMLDVDVAPGRVLQTGLFEPALPAPETLSTLVARLGAVIGESRVGAPALVDTHRPGAFAMRRFAPHQSPVSSLQSPGGTRLESGDWGLGTVSVIRRFRPPRPARVRVGAAGPVHVEADEISGDVATAAGPWRTSGGWWERAWDYDEWDVALANGLTCRLAHDRTTHAWVIEGVLD